MMHRRRAGGPPRAALALAFGVLLHAVPAAAGDDFRVLPDPGVPPRETGLLPLAPIEALMTPELLREWRRRTEPDPVADVGDAILTGPEVVLDGALSLADDLFPRRGRYDWSAEDRKSLSSRLTDWEIAPRPGRIFRDFLEVATERERRYFLNFGDSYLYTPQFELGLEDVDMDDLRYEQGKVFLDALRKTYLMKYRFRPEERIRDDAFGFRGWNGVDFALLPPVMAGYLYLRGLERKFSYGDLRLGVHLEPLSRWSRGEEDLHAGAGLELGVKGVPVSLIVSTGLYDGDVKLDFAGIGTSLGTVRKALRLQRED